MLIKKTPGDLLYWAVVEQGRVPLVRAHHRMPGMGTARHVADRPSVAWCRSCRRIVIRGMGRWWE